jgi:hypothetical protein
MPTQNQTSPPKENENLSSVQTHDHDELLPLALELWGRAGARHWIAIEGRSMSPLLREGDTVLVSHGREGLQRGCVVLFRQKSKLVAHRVLRISRDNGGTTLTTKGDSLRTLDAPVPAERIVGWVVAIDRDGRQRRLDSTGWLVAGWLIAVATLCTAVPYRLGRALMRRLRPNRRSQHEQ